MRIVVAIMTYVKETVANNILTYSALFETKQVTCLQFKMKCYLYS